MRRLSAADRIGIATPSPRRRAATSAQVGIVHFGPGAFHRAHQADYIDRLLDDDPRWGIAAVSLRSESTVAALAEQDGLYTLAIRDASPSMRIIDAHRRFLGPGASRQVLALLADPAVALVSTTVTEKGYCLAPDGTLDLAHPDIVQDLAGAAIPRSVIGWLVAGLAARRLAGTPPFVMMPCDNLAANGVKVKAAMVALARASDAELARWIEGEVHVPSTMVDSITPASDPALLDAVAANWGVRDEAAVQREAFAQWVIEDAGGLGGSAGGPDLGSVGATMTSDVAAFERAKLRILNGAHSTLAYAGLLRGSTSVAEAMGDQGLAGFVDAMIREEIMPCLTPAPGLDLDAYRIAVLQRFRNPAIRHALAQIAQDGSQKLPYRLGDTLRGARARGVLPRRVIAAVACWVGFLMRAARSDTPIIDPSAAALTALAHEGDAASVTRRLAEADIGLSRAMLADPVLMEALETAATAVEANRWSDVLGG